MARAILPFKTPGGNYVYDREVSSILSVSDVEYDACSRVKDGTETVKDWQLLSRYVDQGYLKETKLKEIEHPATPYMPFYLENQMSHICMQVTQNCNLRCSYCAYSGKYENNRTHSDKTMTLDMMKKCVDFIMDRSADIPKIAIGFYGGEPLLQIKKIKKCVEYTQNKYKGKKVLYSITTNGTIFNDEVIQFLEQIDVNLLVSLDGPKEFHDKNRKFENGQGSFDVIMENMRYLKEHHPVFFSKISFNNVISPGLDLSCIDNFYNASEILSENRVSQATINTNNLNENITYDDLYYVTYRYQYMKVLFEKLGMYSKNKISKLYDTSFLITDRFYKKLSSNVINEKTHPGGPCLPGVMRPFVSVDGYIYPCEKVGEDSEIMRIGHIDTGFDEDKIINMLNIAKTTEEKCLNCWNFVNCGICIAACDGNESISKEAILKKCSSSMQNTYFILKTICFMKENGFKFRKKGNYA